MPTQDYESSNIQYAGEFKCSEIALISVTGKIVGIKSATLELNIYEGIFSNFITGDITFTDNFNLMNGLPITGHEYLDFKIRTPIKSPTRERTNTGVAPIGPGIKAYPDFGGYDFTNRRMAVYRVETKQQLSDNVQMITLNFCSPEMIRNQNVRINKAFDGPYDDAVASIFKKEFGLNSKKKCYIQPTNNNFKIVAPNKRPTDVINMIASRAEPKNSILPGYVFFENGQGFHFRSLDSFYFTIKAGAAGMSTLEPVPEMFEFYCSNSDAKNTDLKNEIPLKTMTHALRFELSNMPDIIRSQRAGTYASKLISYDAYNKTFKTFKHNYAEEYNRFPHLEKDSAEVDMAEYRGFTPKTHYDPNDLSMSDRPTGSAYKSLSDYSDARIFVTSDTANTHNTNMSEGYRLKDTAQKRKMAIEFMDLMKLELTAYGNTHLNAGHIIRVNLPRAGDGKTDIKSTQYDKNLSGRWLITAVRHKFNFEETTSQSLYTCVKETYGQGQQTDMGPVKLTTGNEGNPINMYDQSEYV